MTKSHFKWVKPPGRVPFIRKLAEIHLSPPVEGRRDRFVIVRVSVNGQTTWHQTVSTLNSLNWVAAPGSEMIFRQADLAILTVEGDFTGMGIIQLGFMDTDSEWMREVNRQEGYQFRGEEKLEPAMAPPEFTLEEIEWAKAYEQESHTGC